MARLVPYNVTATLTSAGTRQSLSATPKIVRSFTVQARPSNTGNIYIGGSSITSTLCTILTPGATFEVEAPEMGSGGSDDLDLADWYIDGATTGDKVYIVALIRE